VAASGEARRKEFGIVLPALPQPGGDYLARDPWTDDLFIDIRRCGRRVRGLMGASVPARNALVELQMTVEVHQDNG